MSAEAVAPEFPGYDSVAFHALGGSAVVWRARQVSLDRAVAVKQLLPELCAGDDDVERFLAEARALAKMSHPNIVRCIDAFHRGGRFCFVMEFMEGGTLAQSLERHGRLPWRGCLAVADAVASALAHAWGRHAALHCDVKPANIMLAHDGALKITDFGVSQSLARARAAEAEVFGTPHYMAPEQVRGEAALTPQCDMYALGATLYRCATGLRLFDGLDGDAAMEAQVSLQSPHPADIVPGLPPAFCAFLGRLLAKNPAGRPAAWEDVAEEASVLRCGGRGAFAAFSAPGSLAPPAV